MTVENLIRSLNMLVNIDPCALKREVLVAPDSAIPTDYSRLYWHETKDEFEVLVYGPSHTLEEIRDDT